MPSKFSKWGSLVRDRHGITRGRLLQWREKRKQPGIIKKHSVSSNASKSSKFMSRKQSDALATGINVDFIRQKAHVERENCQTKPSATDAGISYFDSLGSGTVELGNHPSKGSSNVSETTTDNSSDDDDCCLTHGRQCQKAQNGNFRLCSGLSYSDSDTVDNGKGEDESTDDRFDDLSGSSGSVDGVTGIQRVLLQTETLENLILGNACLGGEIVDELMPMNSLVGDTGDVRSTGHCQAPENTFEEGINQFTKKMANQKASTRRGRSPKMKQGHNSDVDGAGLSPRSDSRDGPREESRCLALQNTGGCGLGCAITIANSHGDNENCGTAGLASILKTKKSPAKAERSITASLATSVLSQDQAAWMAMAAQKQPPPTQLSPSRLNRGTRASILSNALDEKEQGCGEPTQFIGDVRCSSNRKRDDLRLALARTSERGKAELPRAQREAGVVEGYFKELLSSGIQLQLNDPPSRSPRKKRCGRLFLRFSARSTPAGTYELELPHLLWTDGQGQSYPLELLGIRSIRKLMPSEMEDFPFALQSRSFFLSSDGGLALLLEAADESQLAEVTSALQSIISRLAREIIMGEGDWVAWIVMLNELKGVAASRVVADVADHLVEKRATP